MTAEAEGAFGGSSGPDRPQVDADGRKDRDMENREDALGKLFGLLKLEGNAAKPEIEDAGAAAKRFDEAEAEQVRHIFHRYVELRATSSSPSWSATDLRPGSFS